MVLRSRESFDADDANNNNNNTIILTQILSICLSLYAISDKLINDDKRMFIPASGANKAWLPTSKYICRILFRLCEVVSNLFLLIIIAVYYGALFFTLYTIMLLSVNYILYRNGLLGEEVTNIFAYIVAIMNLGVTPRYSDVNINNEGKKCSNKCIKAFFQKVVSCMYLNFAMSWCNIKFNPKYARFLSYYYLISRIMNGLTILCITIVLFYGTADVNWDCIVCTSQESRNENGEALQIFLFFTMFCYVLQYFLYVYICDSMHLGISLFRNTKTLTMNTQFSDGIRLERIKLKQKKQINSNINNRQQSNDFKIFLKVYNIIIDNNITLAMINNNSKDKNNKIDELTPEKQKEYEYLINEMNDFVEDNFDESQELLIKILEKSIYYCHFTMIAFIISNGWISKIETARFDKNENKNMLSYLVECCYHRMDIINLVLVEYDDLIPFDTMCDLLSHPTGTALKNNKQEHVIHQYMRNNDDFGEIIQHLSEKYWQVFVNCHALTYVLDYNLEILPKYIKLQEYEDQSASEVIFGQMYNVTEDLNRLSILLDMLDENNISICESDYSLYNLCATILHSDNYRVFRKIVKSIALSDINMELKDEYDRESSSVLGMLLKYFGNIKNNLRWARFILSGTLGVDVNKIITKTCFEDYQLQHYKASPLQIAVIEGHKDLVAMMLAVVDNDEGVFDNFKEKPYWQQKTGDKLTDLTQDSEMIEIIQSARLGEVVELAFDHQRSASGGGDAAISQQSLEHKQSSSSIAVKVVEDETKSEQDVSGNYELMAKETVEQALVDSFYDNNFALFDILLEQWNENHKTMEISVVNLQKRSLVDMIYNELGNGQNEANLAIWFGIFEKWNKKQGGLSKNKYNKLINQSISDGNISFVYKLCALELQTKFNSKQVESLLFNVTEHDSSDEELDDEKENSDKNTNNGIFKHLLIVVQYGDYDSGNFIFNNCVEFIGYVLDAFVANQQLTPECQIDIPSQYLIDFESGSDDYNSSSNDGNFDKLFGILNHYNSRVTINWNFEDFNGSYCDKIVNSGNREAMINDLVLNENKSIVDERNAARSLIQALVGKDDLVMLQHLFKLLTDLEEQVDIAKRYLNPDTYEHTTRLKIAVGDDDTKENVNEHKNTKDLNKDLNLIVTDDNVDIKASGIYIIDIEDIHSENMLKLLTKYGWHMFLMDVIGKNKYKMNAFEYVIDRKVKEYHLNEALGNAFALGTSDKIYFEELFQVLVLSKCDFETKKLFVGNIIRDVNEMKQYRESINNFEPAGPDDEPPTVNYWSGFGTTFSQQTSEQMQNTMQQVYRVIWLVCQTMEEEDSININWNNFVLDFRQNVNDIGTNNNHLWFTAFWFAKLGKIKEIIVSQEQDRDKLSTKVESKLKFKPSNSSNNNNGQLIDNMIGLLDRATEADENGDNELFNQLMEIIGYLFDLDSESQLDVLMAVADDQDRFDGDANMRPLWILLSYCNGRVPVTTMRSFAEAMVAHMIELQTDIDKREQVEKHVYLGNHDARVSKLRRRKQIVWLLNYCNKGILDNYSDTFEKAKNMIKDTSAFKEFVYYWLIKLDLSDEFKRNFETHWVLNDNHNNDDNVKKDGSSDNDDSDDIKDNGGSGDIDTDYNMRNETIIHHRDNAIRQLLKQDKIVEKNVVIREYLGALKPSDKKKFDFEGLLQTWKERWGAHTYSISVNRIENSILNLYQRYFNGNDSIRHVLLNDMIFDEKYFCNGKFRYYLESNIIGTIDSGVNGMYLFHSILKNDSLSHLFVDIMNVHFKGINKDKIEWKYTNDLLLFVNENNELPIGCLVFGSYNDKYQSEKFVSNSEFVQLLHQIQYETIRVKIKNVQ